MEFEKLKEYAYSIPKAEMHLHIEGTLEPELIFKLAQKNNITLPYKSTEELRQKYKFKNLQEFLDLYYVGVKVVITEDDFADLALDYCNHACPQGLKYAEIFFDPQSHLSRGISFATMIKGLKKGLDEGKKKYDFDYKLIMCFLRHLPEEEAIKTLKEALPFKKDFFAVGLDSSEVGFPPRLFKNVYKMAADEGLKLVAHAGEEADPSYIKEALDILKVNRIDHGVQIIRDNALMDRVVKEKIPLTLCPLSNKCLKVYPDLHLYPLKKIMEKGIIISVNSDDPSYFGGYIGDNYFALLENLGLKDEDLKAIAQSSFESTFLEEFEKKSYIQKIINFSKEYKLNACIKKIKSK